MKLEDITACKLYKSSPRKQQILIKASSAIKTSKALNVQQPWQVDMPANKQDTANVEIEDADTKQQGDDELPVNDKRRATALKSNVHTRKPSSSKPSLHSSMDQGASKPSTDTNAPDASDNTLNPSSDAAGGSSTSSSDDNVDSATHVTAACGVSLPRIDVTDDMRNEVESIKGTLNSQQLTCGVTRVAVKDDEVWCYYNDSVNLNEVMVEAIDLVSKAGYSYLEFNRLARSDNAIVFVISICKTAEL